MSDEQERFFEAQRLFLEEQRRTSNGLTLEMSRDEMLAHLEDRAAHYATEAEMLAEDELWVQRYIQAMNARPRMPHPMGMPRAPTPDLADLAEMGEETRKQMVEQNRVRAAAFAFRAKHLPAGKAVFVLTTQDCIELELIETSTQALRPAFAGGFAGRYG